MENERIINCKILQKTMLNDKKLEIRIDEPKPEKNNLLYKVQTKPFGWIVYRSFSDFENLRRLIIKFFPEFYIPFLQDANAAENKEKENEYSKTIQCLNLFMNQLVKNESFKTSVVLLAFLSYDNKAKFDNVIKEYSQKKLENLNVEEKETIDGKAPVSNLEKNKKYINNIKKYFELQCEILGINNFALKQFMNNILKADENLKEIKKIFELMGILNKRLTMDKVITNTYENLSSFFKNYETILSRTISLFNRHFEDFFKCINLDGQAFKELIDRRENLYQKYLTEKTKYKERNDNLLIFYNQLGYVDKIIFQELKTIIKEHGIRYLDNIKKFNENYYPLINDQIGSWSELQIYVMKAKTP